MNHYYEVWGPWGVWSLDSPEMGWKAFLVTTVVRGDGICNNPLTAQGPQRETVLPPLRYLLYFSRSYLLCFASSKPSWLFLFGCNELFFFLQKLLTTVPLTELLTNLTSFKTRNDKPVCKQSWEKKNSGVKWPWVQNIFVFVNLHSITTSLQATGIKEWDLSFWKLGGEI